MTAVPDNSPNVRAHTGKAVGRAYYAWRLCFLEGSFRMIINAHRGRDNSLQPGPVWTGVWHLWTVIFPRRSITGRLVNGKVWRRHDGRRWIYKKFVEYRVEG
jgi:hypothetical protein